MLEQRIEQDIKVALLSGDSKKVSTLRLLKSVLLNYKVETGKRQEGLNDEEVIRLLSKEAKKRQESADLYRQGGNDTHANDEIAEKAIIESYLPAQLSEEEVARLVDEALKDQASNGSAALGPVIARVKEQTNGAADGALIARLTKEKLGL